MRHDLRATYFRYSIAAKRRSVPLEGESIAAHLSGCDRVIVFAATLGGGVDALLRRLQVDSMTSAVIADAVASAYIEEYCRECDDIIAAKLSGLHLTWRFSPGYDDFPIEVQSAFIKALATDKKIGLYENDSHMLIPRKSVTAVIGVSDQPIAQARRGCSNCGSREHCRYREGGQHCGF